MRIMARLIAPLAPVALVLFSAMLYNATASNGPSDAQAEAAGVRSLVPANCRPKDPSSRIYDLVGIDTRVAGGIMVRYPERLREVCDVVNRSLLRVSLRELSKSRNLKDLGKERADNTQLMALASSLNMSPEEATVLVRNHGREVLAQQTAAENAPHLANPEQASLVAPANQKLVPDNLGMHYRSSQRDGFGL